MPRLGLDVQYLGHLPHRDLARLQRACDVFVNSPRWAEPFGLVSLEAMACGTPVATLPMGATGEIVGSEGGIVATTNDSAGLADAIVRARDLDRRTVRARAERFTLERMVDTYVDHLADLAELGRGRAVS